MKITSAETSPWQILRRIIVTLLIALPPFLIVYFLVIDAVFSNAVPRAQELDFSPAREPTSAIAEVQEEKHTCGLHAMRSLYRAHGLDPDQHHLRFRLGVDRGALPALESTQGTLQPDITRVLAQDGFRTTQLDLYDPAAGKQLKAHLGKSWFALTLLQRDSNQALHWVLLQDNQSSEDVLMVDSLSSKAIPKDPHDFITRQAVTVFLVEPNGGDIGAEIKRAHRLGVAAMKDTPSRISYFEGKP